MAKKPLVISWIHFLLFTTVFLVPVFSFDYLAYSVIEKTLLFCALITVTGGLWLYAFLKNKEYFPARHNLLTAGGLFLASYTLATVLAASPETAFWSTMTRMSGLLLLLYVAIFVLVLISTVRDEKTWERLMGLAVVAGLWVSGPTYLSYLYPENRDLIKASFGNDSYVAAYLTFALFFSLILCFRSTTRGRQIFFALTSAFIGLSPLFFAWPALANVFNDPISLLGSARAAAASIIIGLVLAGLAYATLVKNQAFARIAQVGFVLSCGALVLGATFIFVPGSVVQQRMSDLGLGSRLVFWESAVEGIKARPLLGYGPENYSVPFYEHFEPALLTEEYGYEQYTSKPHSAYLEVLVSGGVLAFIFYLSIWVFVYRTLWQIWRRGSLTRVETALLMGLITAYLLQNIVLFDTLSSYMGVGILIAYLTYVSSNKENKGYPSISRRFSWRMALVALLVSVPALFFFVWLPLAQQTRLMQVLEGVTVQQRASMYEDLFAISPSMRTSMAEYLMGKSLQVIPSALPSLTEEERGVVLKDVSALRQTSLTYIETNNPVHYRQILYLARLSLLEFVLETDQTKRAALLADVEGMEISLQELSPDNPQNSWIKAQRQLFKGDSEGALATLRAANESVPGIAATLANIQAVEAYINEEGDMPFFTD